MTFFGVGNGLVASYQSYHTGVIVIYDTTFSELAQWDKIWVALKCKNYVVEYDCCTIRKWNGNGADFFYPNDLTNGYKKINALGPSVIKEASIVA